MQGRSEHHKRLEDRNQEMLRLRLEQRLTYRAIGERFGISGNRARQVVQGEIRRQNIPSWQELHDRVKALETALQSIAKSASFNADPARAHSCHISYDELLASFGYLAEDARRALDSD